MKYMFWAAGLVVMAGAGSAWAADAGWGSWWPFGQKEAAAPAPAAAPQAVDVKPDMTIVGKPLDIQPNDRVVGAMTAPVTMIEYASMTCSHCADFATQTMPKVKEEWIKTGKLKYVLRDLPWDNLALGMAKVARCAPAEQFEPLAEAFFADQTDIIMGSNPLQEIKKVAASAGMSGDQVDSCIKDVNLHAQVLGSKEIALTKLGVKGTPGIFVNGTKIEGFVPYADLKKTLDAEYAKAVAAKK